jgi:hypothetical protein
VIFLSDFSFVRIFLWNYRVTMTTTLDTSCSENTMVLSARRGFLHACIFYSPSRRREAPCEGTNSPRLFTPGRTKALAKSKVHQISRAWVTNRGWSSSLISKIWRTVMNNGHWLVQFKVCIITTAWRQRNSKHFFIWWLINFLQIHFIFARIFARFCKFQERNGERFG